VRADPFTGTVGCPAEIQFSGRISVVGGSGAVTYRWIRDDGASAPVQTLTFDGPASRDVTTTWTRGAPGTRMVGWQAIHIIEPKELDSNHAEFDLFCKPS
jgi:hypothetical protein